MKCEYCENELPHAMSICPFCGANIPGQEEKTHPESSMKQRIGERHKSSCRRLVFLLLGLFGGFLGIQFLYARRFFSFAFVMACFILFVYFYDTAAIVLLELIVGLVSVVVSFGVSTDGDRLRMPWL